MPKNEDIEESIMNGQWLGDGILLNIDERESDSRGSVYFDDERPRYYVPSASFFTKDKSRRHLIPTAIVNVVMLPDRYHADRLSEYLRKEIESRSEDEEMRLKSELEEGGFEISFGGRKMTFRFGKRIHELTLSSTADPSELTPRLCTWDEYKRIVSSMVARRPLFRGQNEPWRLRTAFHRRGRADVARFLSEDVPALHRRLSASTRHIFDLRNADEASAFYNLVQHYGYPTPLLDWTYSPYIAAYFACRGIPSETAGSADSGQSVRLFIFDQEQWTADWGGWESGISLSLPRLHLSVGNFIAIENERLTPQRAASTLTNVDDIETFIRRKGAEVGKTYLTAIDLSIQERRTIVRDLRYMGITAGSMFPGLDGACEELADQNFEI